MPSTPESQYILVGFLTKDQTHPSWREITATDLGGAKCAASEQLTSHTASVDLLDANGRLLAVHQEGLWIDIDLPAQGRASPDAAIAPLENLLLARVKSTVGMLDTLHSLKQRVENRSDGQAQLDHAAA